jgi:hypothetical protein
MCSYFLLCLLAIKCALWVLCVVELALLHVGDWSQCAIWCSVPNIGLEVSMCVSFMCNLSLLILYIWYFSNVFKYFTLSLFLELPLCLL